MNVTLYIRRAIKSIIYIAVIFFVLFGVMYYFSESKDPNMSFWDFLAPKHNRLPLFGFLAVFGLAYPFIAYIKKDIYINKPFDEERNNILRIFDTSGYELTGEEGKKLFFRPKNKVSRFMRMMEDTVEVDFSDNPLVLSGIRKEVYRLGKHIEYMSTRASMED